MRIIVFSPTSTKITPTSIQDRPLGGADQVLIRTINALAEIGHEVLAYVPIDKKQVCNNVEYFPFTDLLNDKQDCDLIILYRKAWFIPNTVNYKKAIFYSQDDTDSPCFTGVTKEYFNKFDNVIVLSQYHKNKIIEAFEVPEEKIIIIGNGADAREEVEKEHLTFIYASTPFRGLVVLAKMWKKIIEKYPTAKLHIFSSMKIYDGDLQDQMFFNQLYDKLQKIKGIMYHGSVTQQEVLSYMDRSMMLLYPNTFPETYCNVIMEARASRTPFITSNKGSLKETGGLGGMYVEGNPYTEEYQQEFLNKLFSAIEYPALLEEMKNNCYPIRTWDDHAFDIQLKLIGGVKQ